jgi:hypothetical protein
MKAEELMRNDWVCIDNENAPRQVDWIRSGEVGLLWSQTVTPPYLKPIHLTPEILENNGFTKELDGDGFHYWYTLIADHTKFSLLYVRSIFQWLGPLDFKYVHELQHALRLCGIEKEIVL